MTLGKIPAMIQINMTSNVHLNKCERRVASSSLYLQMPLHLTLLGYQQTQWPQGLNCNIHEVQPILCTITFVNNLISNSMTDIHPTPLFLLTRFNLNPCMDKYSHPLYSVGWNYLSIPKLQWLNSWSLGMDRYFHPTLYLACNYLSKLVLKLNRVSKRDQKGCYLDDYQGYINMALPWWFSMELMNWYHLFK